MGDLEKEGPVLITGFGPFHHHKVNASWEAVKELREMGVEHSGKTVRLETREIPVVYETVSKEVPKLWEDLKPCLCVHVGVSPYNVIKLEKFGNNCGYFMRDENLRHPPDGMCAKSGPETIQTVFRLEDICERAAGNQADVKFETSENAGQFLCDFLYYTSLHVNKGPVVFVHVPALGCPYSCTQLALALQNVIKCLLEALDNSETRLSNYCIK